jgi:hypothetical protein
VEKIEGILGVKSTAEKVSPILLLVFRNGYIKEVATNAHPWGQEITIHLGFHIDFSSMERNKGPSLLIPWCIPRNGVPLVSTNHDIPFFWAPALCL